MGRGLLILAILLPCGAADEVPDLSRVQEINLERAATLPNFVADETTQRYLKRKGDKDWHLFDLIEAEIAVRGRDGFTRQNVRVNGKQWGDKPFPKFSWGVAFGDELPALFDPKCPTVIEFENQAEWEGKPARSYRYSSPPNGCFGTWAVGNVSSHKRYNPARQGRFIVDDEANLVRFEMKASGFPKDFGQDTWTEVTAYDYVRIGDELHLLPVAFDLEVGSSTGELMKAHAEYRNHRHFEANSRIKF